MHTQQNTSIMSRICILLISLLAIAVSTNSYGQKEEAPLKTFEFSISVNQLKTEEQANHIQSDISAVPGVKNCELVLTRYELTFTCTNYDMNQYQIIDRVKAIIIENGSEIVTINRKEQ